MLLYKKLLLVTFGTTLVERSFYARCHLLTVSMLQTRYTQRRMTELALQDELKRVREGGGFCPS